MLPAGRIKLSLFFFITFLISCSGSVPQIGQIIWQVNYTKGPESSEIIPSLSLFILIDDEDGISDIEYIYLIHDESELFWKLNTETWSNKEIAGKNWFGSNKFTMNDNSILPVGQYRVMVIDQAGERDTSELNITSKMLKLDENIKFPKLIIGPDILIESNFSENLLHIYDQSMELLKNLKIEKGKINKSVISNDTNGKAYWISIYSFNENNGTGLIRGPYLFNE